MGQKSRKRQRVGRGVASAACRDTCGRFTGRDEAAAAAAPSDDTPTASHDVEHTADVDHASDGDCADSDSITFLHSDTWYEGGEFADKTVSDEVQWHDDDNLIDVSMELEKPPPTAFLPFFILNIILSFFQGYVQDIKVVS